MLWRRLDDVPEADPLSWSYAVARRCLANARRAQQRNLRLVERVARFERPEQRVAADNSEVLAALSGLKERDREVVMLWAWEGLAPREIAEVMGLSANAVSIRLYKAKRRLAELLGKETGFAGHEPDKGRTR